MSYEDEVLSDNPVAYYPMDETSGSTLNDRSGNGHDGTIQNSPTLDQPGFSSDSRSILFNGVDERVDIATTAVSNHPETVEAWARHTGDQSVSGFGSVVGDREDTGVRLDLMDSRDGWRFVWEGSNDGLEIITDKSSFSQDTWQHLVITHDGSTARLYVDGNEVATYSGKDFTPRSSGEATIATYDPNASQERHFKGYISGVAFYDYELSASRIQAHYDAAYAPADAPDLTATADGSDTISLDWTAVSDADSYHLDVSDDSGSTWTRLADTTATSYDHTGLDPDTTRHYRVRATNSSGDGPWSNTQSATTAKAGADTELVHQFDAPAGAATMVLSLEIDQPASGETHLVDQVAVVQIDPGDTVEWSPGGYLSSATVDTQRRVQQANGTWGEPEQVAADVAYDDAGEHERDDRFAPLNASVEYRSRTTADIGGGVILSSAWEPWQPADTSASTAWLKHPTDPARDQAVKVGELAELTRPSETWTGYPLGYPTAVTRSQGFYGMEADLRLRADGQAERRRLAELLTSGEILLLQTPGAEGDYPGEQWWVAVAGDLTERRLVRFWERHRWVTVRVVEQAAPV